MRKTLQLGIALTITLVTLPGYAASQPNMLSASVTSRIPAAAPLAAPPWQRVEPTLAPAEQPASRSMELPAESNLLQSLAGGSFHSLIIGQPKPEYRSNDISLEGSVSTQIIGSTLNIKADTLANNRSSGTSGTLRLTIWATLSQPFYGGSINGYRLGYYQFTTTLPAGFYFGLPANPPIDRTVTYAGNPPNGTYYVTMTADEYSSSNNPNVNDGFGYHDLVVMNSTWTFGPPAPTACSYSLSAFSATVGPSGGTGTLSVSGTPSGCSGSWSAFSNVSWISITSGGSGSGSGSFTVSYFVATNTSSSSRTGTMTITGQSFTVTQQGASGQCVQDFRTACVLNNRFKVTVRYRGAFDNALADTDASLKSVTGFANASYETVFFYFNSANNVELLLKMLDQGNTDSQGHPTIAVLFGTATPLRIELTITDTATGVTKKYSSSFGAMQGTTDFTAFVK